MQRVTITIDDELMTELDRIIASRGYQNRSEAIRDLARAGIREAAETLDATRDCVDEARSDLRACYRSGADRAGCRTIFETAYSKCFAAGAGVTCGKRCITRETTCLGAVPATRKTCRKTCRTAVRRDVRACRRIATDGGLWAGGDAGCLTTARANLDLCRFVCTQAVHDCHTSLKFCVANCANL